MATEMRSPILSEPLQTSLKELLAQQTGLNFNSSGWRDFAPRFAAAAKDAGAADTTAYARQLLSSPLSRGNIETLARHLTVGETYFFRDKRSFDALAAHVLPELLRSRELSQRRLRIWSAGCCTGEEAYSIAILLDRLLPQQDNWDISIVATDINPRFLQKAERAIYGEWSFRGTPDWVRNNYFTPRRNNTYELVPKIRERVKFAYLNLAENVYPSAANNTDRLDAIFCRNVLMYFSPDQARSVVRRFRAAIHENGLLLVNPAETSAALFADFSLVHYPGASFYQHHKQPANGVAPASVGETFKSPLRTRTLTGVSSGKIANNVTDKVAKKAAIKPAAKRTAQRQPLLSGISASSTVPREAAATKLADITKPAQTTGTMRSSNESAASFARRARAAADEGNLDQAASLCEHAIALEKLEPAFHYLLATIEQERGRIATAVQALQRTLYLNHEFVLAHFALANLRLIEGRRKDAARHLETVRKLLQNHPEDETLTDSDGLTVGRLNDIANSLAESLKGQRHTAVYG